MTIEFHPIQTSAELETLARIASEIWREYWPALIGEAQAEYMIERFQSKDALKRDMTEHHYEYWLIIDDDELLGYTGGHQETATNRFFISKIYLFKHARGKGYTRRIVAFYDQLCHQRKLSALYLTVNKHNELAIRAYCANNFRTIDAVETDIGEGFIMDDYIMERTVSPPQ